jgi:hypothetical protein
MPIDDFEDLRSMQRRTSPSQLQLNRDIREVLLLEWGISRYEIAQAVRENMRVKHQRRRTVASLGTYDVIEEMIERTTRKIKHSLFVGKKIDNWNTDQRKNTIEWLKVSSKESEMRRREVMTLKNMAIDFPEAFTTPTNASVGTDEFDMIRPAVEKEFSGNAAPCSTSTFVEILQQSPQAIFDKAPMIPRRPASPTSSQSTHCALSAKDCIVAALKVSCPDARAKTNDPDFNLHATIPHFGMSVRIQEDFDESITTCETGDDRILTFSFHHDDAFDSSILTAVNQIKKAPQAEDPKIKDEESTIRTCYIDKIVHATDICTSVIETTENTPTFHTSAVKAIRREAFERSITKQPIAKALEHDDETSIDSQLIEFLFGFNEISPHLEHSDGTWSEANRSTESSTVRASSFVKLNQSIEANEKCCVSKYNIVYESPVQYHNLAPPVKMEVDAEHAPTSDRSEEGYTTPSLLMKTCCNGITTSNKEVERSSSVCGTTSTTSTTVIHAIPNTQIVMEVANVGAGYMTRVSDIGTTPKFTEQDRRHHIRPLNEVRELFEV